MDVKGGGCQGGFSIWRLRRGSDGCKNQLMKFRWWSSSTQCSSRWDPLRAVAVSLGVTASATQRKSAVYGSWKYSPEGHSVANDHELQNALAKMKNRTPKVQDCLACEYGINVNLGREHTFQCRQTILTSLVIGSSWMVKFDAVGEVLKRHEHGDDVGHRDSKRVRFTHKQPDKRPDMELTDETMAKGAKLFDTSSSSSSLSSSSSSSDEVALNLHGSSGGIGDPETRESAMKKSQVDAEMEVSATEALTNAKLKGDRALDKANKTASLAGRNPT